MPSEPTMSISELAPSKHARGGRAGARRLDEPDVEGRVPVGHEPPPGWMVVRHASVGRYVHLPTKMCTWGHMLMRSIR